MIIPNRQTFLGGELANLDWEDLNRHELVMASQGSMAQAEAMLPLVDAQIDAAHEFADNLAMSEFSSTRRTLLGILGLNATPKELAVRVQNAHKLHSVINLAGLALAASRHAEVTREDNPARNNFRVVSVMALFLANFNDRSLSPKEYSYTLLTKDFETYRALLPN